MLIYASYNCLIVHNILFVFILSIIDLSVYVLEDNSTDSDSNVAQNKTFLSATTVRSLLTTSNGSVALTGM